MTSGRSADRWLLRSAVTAVVGLVAATLGPANAATASVTSSGWSMTSAAGDPVGLGQTYAYVPPDMTFTITGTASSLEVAVASSSYDHWWWADFAAPEGQTLTSGTVYSNAERAPADDPTRPGLDVAGDGRGCSAVTGSFEVDEITIDPVTQDVTSFGARFEQHCDNLAAPLVGEILLNTDYPMAPASTTQLSTSPTLPPGSDVLAIGSVSDSEGPMAGAPVQVTRWDASGTTQLPPASTDDSGTFTASDTLGSSDAVYVATYWGDAGHQPSTASAAVQAQKLPSVLRFTAPKAAERGKPVRVSGQLSSRGTGVAAKHLTLVRVDLAGDHKLGTVLTAADGTFSMKDVPQVGGVVTYRVSWPGSQAMVGAQATRQVQVSRDAAPLSITTSRALFPFGAKAQVTAHLGRSYNNRRVTIYAVPIGPTPSGVGSRIRTGRVNSDGNLSVEYRMHQKTRFTVVFEGDFRFRPERAAVTANSTTRVSVAMTGSTGRSGNSYVYVGVDPVAVAHAAPNRAGDCVSWLAQAFRDTKWVHVASLKCTKLDSGSAARAVFVSKHVTGVQYRIRASIGSGRPSGAGRSPWRYFIFR